MAISKKASLFLILLVGAVGLIMKFLLNPFSSKEATESTNNTEVVVEDVPSEVPTPAPVPAESLPAPAPTSAPIEPSVETPVKATAKKISLNTSYKSPAGMEDVGFVLNVDASGVVKSAEAVVHATQRESVKYQNSFRDNFSTAVVGKKLSDLSRIDRVGKASLTTNASNASLSKLKAQI